MKNLLKYTWVILAAILVVACEPSYNHPDASKLPKASDIVANVTVDQSTNTATFSFNTPGCSPAWIFATGEVITKFNFTKYHSKKGIYSVELKCYNQNGLSDGSITLEYEIENTDFDPAAALSKDKWVLARTRWGHIGCGESGTAGTNWWAANAGEKMDCGLYDDVLTFNEDGTYEYNPGMGGTVYVNKDASFGAEYNPHDGNDYQAPTTVQKSTWQMIDEGGNSYLVFPANTIVGYIPNNEALANPKYKVISLDDDVLELSIDNGGIAWHYIYVRQTFEGEKYTGDKYEEKIKGTWAWEPSQWGHIGCGEPNTTGTNWWGCDPYGKMNVGLYDDILTFGANGAYTFDPGKGGTVYVNAGYPVAGTANEDYQIQMDVQNSTYSIEKDGDNYYLVFPPNTVVSYIPNIEAMNAPKYKIERLTEFFLDLVNDNGGIAWHYRFTRVK